MSTIKERPILFSGPMVRAILDGKKTQTRRPIKSVKGFGAVTEFKKSSTPGYDFTFRCRRRLWQDFRNSDLIDLSPFGPPGTLLWLKEKARLGSMSGMGGKIERVDIVYAEPFRDGSCIKSFSRSDWRPYSSSEGWTPSIHMPRWASRITLRNKRTWVERVQNISEEDARAEGMFPLGPVGNVPVALDMGVCRYQFANLWQSVYPGSWDANDWVWACEFERVPSAT